MSPAPKIMMEVSKEDNNVQYIPTRFHWNSSRRTSMKHKDTGHDQECFNVSIQWLYPNDYSLNKDNLWGKIQNPDLRLKKQNHNKNSASHDARKSKSQIYEQGMMRNLKSAGDERVKNWWHFDECENNSPRCLPKYIQVLIDMSKKQVVDYD